MNRSRFSAVAAASLAIGLGLASAPAANAYEFTCAKITGATTSWAYIKDQNSACGTVRAIHWYSPQPYVNNVSTGWYYDGSYARTPTLPTLTSWKSEANV